MRSDSNFSLADIAQYTRLQETSNSSYQMVILSWTLKRTCGNNTAEIKLFVFSTWGKGVATATASQRRNKKPVNEVFLLQNNTPYRSSTSNYFSTTDATWLDNLPALTPPLRPILPPHTGQPRGLNRMPVTQRYRTPVAGKGNRSGKERRSCSKPPAKYQHPNHHKNRSEPTSILRLILRILVAVQVPLDLKLRPPSFVHGSKL